jgi:hypothetical protein
MLSMQPVPPFWFRQRQAKAEPAGDNTYRLTAPQQQEAFITIRRGENGRWTAALKLAADGPEVAVTQTDYDREDDAWGAAFELYRIHVIL